MPAVETWPAVAPGARENTGHAASNSTRGQPAAGGDFDSMMKVALAPSAPKSPDKTQPRTGKHPPGFEKFSPASAPAHAAAAMAATSETAANSPAEISADKTDGATAGSENKTAPGAVENGSPTLNASPFAAGAPWPTVFSPAQFFFSQSPAGSAGDQLPPGKLNSVEKISSSTVQPDTTGKIAAAVLPVTGNAVSARTTAKPSGFDPAGQIETPGVAPEKTEPEKNLLLKNPSPVTPAAAGSTEPAPAMDKTIPATAAAPDAPVNPASLMLGNENILPAKPAATTDLEKTPNLDLDAAAVADVKAAASDIRSSPAVVAARAAENAGTGVATTVSSMKNPQKTNNVAGLDVKVLPGADAGEAREKNLPAPLLVTPVRAADHRGADLNFSFSNGHAPAADNAPGLNALALPSLADARLRAVERAHDMMSLHSMRLVESKSDALSVVIKPAVGTELALELRQRNGGVEAHATLTRGDHQFLNQHWPELQQRLELRGIKLAPLGGEGNLSAGGNGDFPQHQASREEEAQQASAFAEFASAGPAGGATARLAAVHEGWESWA